MYYWRIYNMNNTTYRRTAKKRNKILSTRGRKQLLVQDEGHLKLQFSVACSWSFCSSVSHTCVHMLAGRLSWSSPHRMQGSCKHNGKINAKAFLQWWHFLLKMFIGLQREKSTCSSHSQIRQVLKFIGQKTMRCSSHLNPVWRTICSL